MNCATCTSWDITTSPLKAANMAPCGFGNRWEYLPPTNDCGRYGALEPVLFAKRVKQLERILKKYQGVMK